MRDAESKKDARFEFRLHPNLKARVEERPDISGAEAARHGFEIAAFGEEVASVERLNERDMAVVGIYESAFEPLVRQYENAIPELGDRLRDALYSAAHEVTRDCYERVQWAEAEAAERESDSGVAMAMAEMSLAEAVHEYLFSPDEERVREPILTGTQFADSGPANPAVQTAAEKCGIEPEEFWNAAREEWPEAFEPEHSRLQSVENSRSVATDGGEPR